MKRLGVRDRRLASRIAEEIVTVRLGEGPGVAWSRVLNHLAELLDSRVPCFVRFSRREAGWRADAAEGLQLSAADGWHRWFEGRSARAVAAVSDLADADGIHRAWQRCGLVGQDLIRLQVRRFDSVWWLGGYRPMGVPFGPRERLALGSLKRSIVKRLEHEEMTRQYPVIEAGLRAALDALGGPAVLLARDGRVLQANSAGRRRLEQPNGHVGATQPRAGPWKVVPASGGVSVAMLEAAQGQVEPQWLLTPRERQTLELILEGLSNRTIAGMLDCSERTVEVHVSRLLAKSGSVSRAQLISRFVSRPPQS